MLLDCESPVVLLLEGLLLEGLILLGGLEVWGVAVLLLYRE